MSGIVGSNLGRGSGVVKVAALPDPLPAASGVNLTALNATNLGSGTVADARISESSVTQHVSATDTSKIENDIATLALHSAVGSNQAAHGLANSWIEVFQDTTYVAFSSTMKGSVGTQEFVGSIVSDHGVPMVYQHNLDNSLTPVTNTVSGTIALNGGAFTANGRTGYGAEWPENTASSQGLTLSISGDIMRSYCFWMKLTDNIDQYSGDFRGHSESQWRSGGADTWRSGDYLNGVLLTGNVNINTLELDVWHHSIWPVSSTGITIGSRYAAYGGTFNTNACVLDNIEVYEGTISEANAALVYAHVGNVGAISNASGTVISTTITPQDGAAKTSIGVVVAYKNNEGTATLNTDLVIKVSANDGSNYTTCVLAAKGTFSTGILMAIAPAVTVTSGTQLKYHISFANQSAGSKETHVYGVAMTY